VGWGLKRHKELTIRQAEKLGTSRVRMMNPVVVQKYFDDLETIIEDLNLQDQPQCIWDCDETGRRFEHNPVRVIADKWARNVVSKTSNSRSNGTIMACVNAMGRGMPQMFELRGNPMLPFTVSTPRQLRRTASGPSKRMAG
jgi:hypothetical protein